MRNTPNDEEEETDDGLSDDFDLSPDGLDGEHLDDSYHPLAEPLQQLLKGVEGPGDFCTAGRVVAPIPRLTVKGLGVVAFPLLPVQAAQLRDLAEVAPYGRGAQTLIDPAVRSGWQLSSDDVVLDDPWWAETLDLMVKQAAVGLGVAGEVQAQLYKLLLYEEGGHFVSHRDTEKVAGMFGTLVVVLPSLFEGGGLLVQHQGRTCHLPLSSEVVSELSFAAFYADCLHELRPVTKGFRLALVFNLVMRSGAPPKAPMHQEQILALRELLLGWPAYAPPKLAYVLEHRYSSDSLAWEALKNTDAACAQVLSRACEGHGLSVQLAMVRIEEWGIAEPRVGGPWGRRGRSRSEEDTPFDVIEVTDRSVKLTEWRPLDPSAPGLPDLALTEEELSPAGALDEEKFDEQVYMEATGNEGASFSRSYRRACLVIWPDARRAELLSAASAEDCLSLLQGLVLSFTSSGQPPGGSLWQDAADFARAVLEKRDQPFYGQALDGLVDALCLLQDPALLNLALRRLFRGEQLSEESAERVLRMGPLLGWQGLSTWSLELHSTLRPLGALALLGILNRAREREWARPSPQRLAETLEKLLPRVWEAGYREVYGPFRLNAPQVQALLQLLHAAQTPKLVQQVWTALLSQDKFCSLETSVVPALCEVWPQADPAGRELLAPVQEQAVSQLHTWLGLALEAPQDLVRKGAKGCTCAACQDLNRFMADPVQAEWKLRAREEQRRHLESVIHSQSLDLDTRTLRQGSPHTLCCTKNQRSYDLAVKRRDSLKRSLRTLSD